MIPPDEPTGWLVKPGLVGVWSSHGVVATATFCVAKSHFTLGKSTKTTSNHWFACHHLYILGYIWLDTYIIQWQLDFQPQELINLYQWLGDIHHPKSYRKDFWINPNSSQQQPCHMLHPSDPSIQPIPSPLEFDKCHRFPRSSDLLHQTFQQKPCHTQVETISQGVTHPACLTPSMLWPHKFPRWHLKTPGGSFFSVDTFVY